MVPYTVPDTYPVRRLPIKPTSQQQLAPTILKTFRAEIIKSNWDLPRLIANADFDCVFMCIYGNKQEKRNFLCVKGEKVLRK